MVLQLNNIVNFQSSNKDMEILSHNKYPEQDTDFVGKFIKIKYMDELAQSLYIRFYINKDVNTEYTGPTSYQSDVLFKIVRFDKVEPYRAILVCSMNNAVIVSTTDKIKSLTYYPTYNKMISEAPLTVELSWNDFNAKIYREYIFSFPVQNFDYIGRQVYTEYKNDIINLPESENKLNGSTKGKTPEELKAELLAGNHNLDIYQDNVILSFPHYYNRHQHDTVDIPKRAINQGYVIRCDMNSVKSEIVVAEYMNDQSVRYVTGDEAYIYFHEEQPNIKIGELPIWQ